MTDAKKSAPPADAGADDSRETSALDVLAPDPSAPAWISDELNRIYKRLGHVVDLMEDHGTKVEELLTDSRAARPLLERYLKMTGGLPWARGKAGRH